MLKSKHIVGGKEGTLVVTFVCSVAPPPPLIYQKRKPPVIDWQISLIISSQCLMLC